MTLIIFLDLVVFCVAQRDVSFWYGPASYGGNDINNTLNLLAKHRAAVSSVMVYCGHSNKGDGIEIDSQTNALCLQSRSGPNGFPAFFPAMAALGIKPELVLDSGASNISDYRLFFENATANIAAMVDIGKQFGAKGWNIDFEPQVGSPASTPADATLYAAFLQEAKAALNENGMRLTIAVAQWSPMLSQFAVLAPSVDRILNMETYNADSMSGWLNGDNYGGYYTKMLAPGVPRTKAGPGLGCWPAKCGKHMCWSTTASSAAERMDRITNDSMPEVALFRIIQVSGYAAWPEDFWWPLLKQFRSSPLIS